MTIKEKICLFVGSPDYRPTDRAGLAAAMNIPERNLPRFHKELEALIGEGSIVESRKTGRLQAIQATGLEKGVLRVNTKGFGFILREEGDDLYVSGKDLKTAVNGDTVLARLIGRDHNGRESWAIYSVLKRGNDRIVGQLKLYPGWGIVTPDNERLPHDIIVSDNGKALDGQKVVVRITEYGGDSLQGVIDEVLGFPDDFGVDVLSVIKDYGFETEFPKNVLAKAAAVPAEISPGDLEGRLDLRDKLIITIDGDDSKDLDDAVSLEKTSHGWRLGVHIADVSNYVKPGSPLDKEALNRGTSVYLADRVIPMLPPRLSNGICSLNQGEDRLTLSVFMDMDDHGNVIKSEFYKSVIRSARRMTYNNVEKLIKDSDTELEKKYADILPMLRDMHALSKKLQKLASERGYVDLSIPESKAVLDENGKAVDIELRQANDATRLIEFFMVCANMAVAEHLSRRHIPAVYRVHGLPDESKLRVMRQFISGMGINPNLPTAEILKAAKGTPGEAIVSAMILRSMAKAEYGPENLGHYGLGADYYCHFTSPIRRYPDLVCHRALKAAIENDAKALRAIDRTNADAAERSSEREVDAERCERDVLDMKKAEYMEQFVGQDFEGIISSVTNFGFFVALPNTVEGLVSVTSLSDDYYIFDEKALLLRGERLHREYRLGDQIEVTLVSSNKHSRRIEFVVKGQKPRSDVKKEATPNGGKQRNKNSGAKQKRISRVFHRRKNRGRH